MRQLPDSMMERRTMCEKVLTAQAAARFRRVPEHLFQERFQRPVPRRRLIVKDDGISLKALKQLLQAPVFNPPRKRTAAHDPAIDIRDRSETARHYRNLSERSEFVL